MKDGASKPVLIAGGGIAGFAAALALSRKGIASRVIEQAERFSETGAGIQLGPNVFRMFEQLGLTEQILSAAVLPDALVMRDGLTGEPVTRIPLNTGEFRARFVYPYGVIYRPDLHNSLIEAATASPLVEAVAGEKIVSFEETDAGVSVTSGNGNSHQGCALIGADGLWSRIRAKVIGDGKPRVSGHIAYRAVLPAAQVPSVNSANEVILWAGPRTHLVHYPLHRGEIWNLVAVFHSDRYEEGWDVFGDVDELIQRFHGQIEGVLGMLEKIEAWRMWVLCDREPQRHWSRGKVVLVGDAAHPMLQYLAQGACMAIEDAVCLAEAMAARPHDPATAFAEYVSARYLRTARVQIMARVYGDVYHAAGPVAELRAQMLKERSAASAYDGMAWLYAGVDNFGRQIV